MSSFYSLLESTLQTVFELDPGSLRKLACLNGRTIAIEVTGSGKTIYISGLNNEIRLLEQCIDMPDTIIRGTPLNLVRLAFADDVAPLLLSGKISMDGDMKLGRQIKSIFSSLDIDREELLSHHIGDVAAHQLTRWHERISIWIKRSGQSFSQDMGDYLQEEARLLPSKAEQRRWLNQVDELRTGADRLRARIDRLVTTHGNKT